MEKGEHVKKCIQTYERAVNAFDQAGGSPNLIEMTVPQLIDMCVRNNITVSFVYLHPSKKKG